VVEAFGANDEGSTPETVAEAKNGVRIPMAVRRVPADE
jgi:hypothetical protein